MSSNSKDYVAEFSPSADFFAIATCDGRVKIWNTTNGLLQSEFTNMGSVNMDDGHLSLDYTCMKWRPTLSSKKRKKKDTSSLLVLGTGGGDILALDTTLGQVQWKSLDCHPGGVTSISFTSNGQAVYSTGSDGMVCTLDCETGEILGRFKASKKLISCLAVSPDGQKLVVGTSEVKVFNLQNKKKIQKFTGHPDSVRAMLFTNDSNHILSSSFGERHIAIWTCDGTEDIKAASRVLSMEHPAKSFDCKSFRKDDAVVNVLAVSEAGDAYLWHNRSFKELKLIKPAKITLLPKSDTSVPYAKTGSRPGILAAKMQNEENEESVNLIVAHGNSVKPYFERVIAKYDTDTTLKGSEKGLLLSSVPAEKLRKRDKKRKGVTVLGPENVEDAVFPKPSLEVSDILKREVNESRTVADMKEIRKGREQDQSHENMDTTEGSNEQTMEERLIQLGILEKENDTSIYEKHISCSKLGKANSLSGVNSEVLKGLDDMLLNESFSLRNCKVFKKIISELSAVDVLQLLKVLVAQLKLRPYKAQTIISWINVIVKRYYSLVSTDEDSSNLLESLHQILEQRLSVFQQILQLHGRLDLLIAQISAKKTLQEEEPTITMEEIIDEHEVELVNGVDEIDNDENSESENDEVVNDTPSENGESESDSHNSGSDSDDAI